MASLPHFLSQKLVVCGRTLELCVRDSVHEGAISARCRHVARSLFLLISAASVLFLIGVISTRGWVYIEEKADFYLQSFTVVSYMIALVLLLVAINF